MENNNKFSVREVEDNIFLQHTHSNGETLYEIDRLRISNNKYVRVFKIVESVYNHSKDESPSSSFRTITLNNNERFIVENFEGKVGMMDSDGKVIIPIKYKRIEVLDKTRIAVCLEPEKIYYGKEYYYALYSSNGKQITDFCFRILRCLVDNRLYVCTKDNCKSSAGVMDRNGKEIIPRKYDPKYFKVKKNFIQLAIRHDKGKHSLGLFNFKGVCIVPEVFSKIILKKNYIQAETISYEYRGYSRRPTRIIERDYFTYKGEPLELSQANVVEISEVKENTTNLRSTGAYTHGSLSCPYCNSNATRTYIDGTAECSECGGEFIYAKV